MAKDKRRTGKGRQTERVRFGSMEARVSGKTMILSNDRSPAEQKQFVERVRAWRAQADDEFRGRRDALLAAIRPYRALALLGYVYFSQTTANPETYREWEHKGQAAKVEHFALLLALRPSDGLEEIVPIEVSSAVDEYLNYLFSNLAPYYDDMEDRGSPTDPDPRSLVLMWELGVRMPLYPWQYRSTLQQLFDPLSPWMERALGFTIRDALAVELAFETCTNAMLARESPALSAGMSEIRKVIEPIENGFVAKPGHEAEATRLWSDYQERWSASMARIGDGIALNVALVAAEASIDIQRTEAVLEFFTTERGSIPVDYFIPIPDSPLKLRPFLRFDARWTLPSSSLLLPAMQPAIERALNPDFRAATADKDAWHAYDVNRADLVETRAAAALSGVLDGATVYRNLKYKTAPGQDQPFELDALGIRDGKLFLVECKGGAFSSAARRGDLNAIEARIGALVTDAHRQAIRALEYIESNARPTFRVDGQMLVIEKSEVDEVFLITTTLEELGYLTARFNEVHRLATTTMEQTPWVVPLHDLELVAKYITTGPEFVHYVRRRILLNAQSALGAFDELDWLGRYFYDALTLADAKQYLSRDRITTGSLASHKTEFDDFEHYQNGVRQTPATRPTSNVHDTVRKIVLGLVRWSGRGYIDTGVALLDLPPKLQRHFAKRIAHTAQKVGKARYLQEVAVADDGDVLFACTVCGAGVDLSQVADPPTYGSGRRNVHVFVDPLFNVYGLRSDTGSRRTTV